ncbi:TPA: hypothetical protein DIU22_03635 [Candidatus Woesebacteria bacterium]|nr:hypothetical protein [Candidatus Woesebacteria bacterium]
MISVISPLVILNQRLFEITKQFLTDVRAGLSSEDEIIIVDNGSTVDMTELIKMCDIYVKMPKPIGYGGAMNIGAKISRADYVVFANNDMRVGPDWAQKMLEKFNSDPKIGIVSCHGPHMIPSTGTAFNGIFWMLNKKVLADIGYFDMLYPREGDDSDFCLRAVAAGWEISTAEFFFEHPERKSTHNQAEFDKLLENSSQLKCKKFHEKWGFNEINWYREGLKLRKI